MTNLPIYPHSVVELAGTQYSLVRPVSGQPRLLAVRGDASGFEGTQPQGDGLVLAPCTPANAAELRRRLPWLCPQPLGLRACAGMGDRLGLATPGHIHAVRGTGLAPVFAQQSVRENARTGRSPQDVLDDAMWGVFQEGWREPWGADADHLKTTADANACAAAGFTFFTIDPGDHVDNAAHTDPESVLLDKVKVLPWDALDSSPDDLYHRYLDQTVKLDGLTLTLGKEALLRAAAKYGRAVAHTVAMYRHLVGVMARRPFELEVSVDETATPTTAEEHFYVASELRRLGVQWVSLAPRFVGRFEKGVDYIGDLAQFESEFAKHVAVMRHFGGYKISLHSGSDKFSIYAIAARHADGLVHLKTAGTSYLEGLRVLARHEPALFRAILALGRQRYETDRASYHVSAVLDKVPAPADVPDAHLPALLDQFDARQVLHVTFGAALAAYGTQIKAALQAHEEAYREALVKHFTRHLAAFAVRSRP